MNKANELKKLKKAETLEEKLIYFYSIGPIQAKKILKQLKDLKIINEKKRNYSLSELRTLLKNHKIFNKLSIATKIDLTYNPIRVIPRAVINLIDDELSKYNLEYTIAGSYIRGKPTSGDIDMVLILNDTWLNIMNKINANTSNIRFHEPFAQGADKITTLIEVDLEKSGLSKKYPELKELYKCNSSCKINVKMDIFLTDHNDYMFALLFATGSGVFNIRMRSVAKKHGYLLNHHGLFKKDNQKLDKIPIKDIEELFSILKIKYRSPTERNL